ncbi:bifunctional 3,4-dihydroxy-2-butanone-4-phosphate synthase/GTP cyclohydrolase II [bacterium]|nr:bifunctional 3,4-dihydroxy-2-butanone-4-phosphate synthase/GTP cyclohydrolase II [bacterium]|tara:strand:+ start:1072 stop:2298 length:1227 start_codon:yes stop_codon:yes gene_type:complete
MSEFNTVESVIAEIKKGRPVIVVDRPDRENEGDFVLAAELATPETINFILTHGRGLLCVPMAPAIAQKFNLDRMVPDEHNQEFTKCKFTISVDAAKGITTGISASDRYKTIELLADPKSKASGLVSPGHIFPLIATHKGLVDRDGHTEAAVDLARLAGLQPVGVISEILNQNGAASSRQDLFNFAKTHDLNIISIDQIKKYLTVNPLATLEDIKTPVLLSAPAELPTPYGRFISKAFRLSPKSPEHVVSQLGKIDTQEPVLVRVHSRCLTSESLGSQRCDCKQQLERSMELIAERGSGLIIYLDQEGRGIGLANKLNAYNLQDHGLDTVEANNALGFADDLRDFTAASKLLLHLGITKVELLTNNPMKVKTLAEEGIMVDRIQLNVSGNNYSQRYLNTKHAKLGHHRP